MRFTLDDLASSFNTSARHMDHGVKIRDLPLGMKRLASAFSDAQKLYKAFENLDFYNLDSVASDYEKQTSRRVSKYAGMGVHSPEVKEMTLYAFKEMKKHLESAEGILSAHNQQLSAANNAGTKPACSP